MSINPRRASSLVACILLLCLWLAAGERPEARQDQSQTIGVQAIQIVFIKPQIPFKAASLGGALLGAVGQFAVDRPAGAVLVERFGITDCALRVKDTFVTAIPLDPSRVQTIAGFRESDDVSKIKANLGSAGYALEFRTILTNVLPFGMDGGHQRIEYWVRARLIRLETGSVVWKETAKFIGSAPKGQRPTAEEMLANEAAVLKEKLNEAADTCAQELARKFRGQK